MSDDERVRKQDFTVWIDRNGTTFTATFECQFIITETPATRNEPKDVSVEWIDYYPISASFLDKDDAETSWRYGDNMPSVIANAFERYKETLESDITLQAKESR